MSIPYDEERLDLVAALRSDNIKVRWEATKRAVAELFNGIDHTADEAVIPLLIRELDTDYTGFEADQIAAADKKFDDSKRDYETRLADYNLRKAEAKALGKQFTELEPYFYYMAEAFKYDGVMYKERHHTAVIFLLLRFPPEKLLPALPALLKLKWANDRAFAANEFDEPTLIHEAHEELLDKIGPLIIPDLIQALGQGEPAATHAAKALGKLGREALPHLFKAIGDPDIVVRQRVDAMLSELRAVTRVEKPSALRDRYSQVHARLLALLDKADGDPKTKERLRMLRSFAQHGSFRQVAAAEAKLNGFDSEIPDHSGPASRVRRLGETLGVALTRPSDGPGVKRTDLTDEGRSVVDWIDLHPWALD